MNRPRCTPQQLLQLETWFTACPSIEFASLIGSSLTIKFRDGSLTVLLDLTEDEPPSSDHTPLVLHQPRTTGRTNHTALLLNTAAYVYGHHQCYTMMRSLLRHGYSIEYRANDAVDVPFLRQNFSADIVYMNTHAGVLDVDGDHIADAVVIATGEFWTNDTEQKYEFEYQNNLIVKGMIGTQGVVAFTPAFIDYYYDPGDFSDALVYMATCHATYDSSMAQTFLNASAAAYMGWSASTVFWTNSRTSVSAMRLLTCGLSVAQVCRLIRAGGIMNWLFHSQLMYYGDGAHQIPR